MLLTQDGTSFRCVSCSSWRWGWGGLITQLHVFHLTTSHNVQRVTVFMTALSLMYAFKVFHCEVMLKVVLITLLTAEPYGFPS